MASNAKKAGQWLSRNRPRARASAGRSWRRTPLKAPTSPPDSGLAPQLAPAPLNGYVSPGGAGRADKLRRTRLYRGALASAGSKWYTSFCTVSGITEAKLHAAL